MTEVIDESMCATLDALYSLPLAGTEQQLLYAYYRGRVDFIRSIYDFEVNVRSATPDGVFDMEATEAANNRISSRIREMYGRIVGAIFR